MQELLVILRDRREAAHKCSLTPLRGHPGVRFVPYHRHRSFDAGDLLLLHPDGELLTADDAGRVPLILDCSWRRVPTLMRTVTGSPAVRRLPRLTTAYPRQGTMDPGPGLASIEAACAALAILGRDPADLLACYEWAESFVEANATVWRADGSSGEP